MTQELELLAERVERAMAKREAECIGEIPPGLATPIRNNDLRALLIALRARMEADR